MPDLGFQAALPSALTESGLWLLMRETMRFGSLRYLSAWSLRWREVEVELGRQESLMGRELCSTRRLV